MRALMERSYDRLFVICQNVERMVKKKKIQFSDIYQKTVILCTLQNNRNLLSHSRGADYPWKKPIIDKNAEKKTRRLDYWHLFTWVWWDKQEKEWNNSSEMLWEKIDCLHGILKTIACIKNKVEVVYHWFFIDFCGQNVSCGWKS